MQETQSSRTIYPKLHRIARMAKDHPDRAFTNLAHHIDLVWMREAYRRTRKDGAVGVDGVTGADYAENLEANLTDLLNRAKSGRYRAPAVRRVHISKGEGRTRPLGIPTFEDKLLQGAVKMVLEAVYEQDFLDCSFGYRPRRSAHQALDRIWKRIMDQGGGWILEADIRDCFGTLDHAWMRRILSQRIRDGVLMRLLGKWLKADILEEGERWQPESGTPQGGVISPLLSNVYLHEVLDLWFVQVLRPSLAGNGMLIRFADDFVIVFEHETDARQVYELLPSRFAAHGLELHPGKTHLVPFQRPHGNHTPPSFDFLGFTHYWSKARSGYWIVKRKTMKKRLNRGLKAIGEWCRQHRHDPIRDQQRHLNYVVRGHCGYYGITGNSEALQQFREGVRKLWRKWLKRRSNAAARQGRAWWDGVCRHYPIIPARAEHSVLRRT